MRRSNRRPGRKIFEEGSREVLGENAVVRDEFQCLLFLGPCSVSRALWSSYLRTYIGIWGVFGLNEY